MSSNKPTAVALRLAQGWQTYVEEWDGWRHTTCYTGIWTCPVVNEDAEPMGCANVLNWEDFLMANDEQVAAASLPRTQK